MSGQQENRRYPVEPGESLLDRRRRKDLARIVKPVNDHWQPLRSTGADVGSTCLNCPPRAGALRYDDTLDPGFGAVALFRDGVGVVGGLRASRRTIREWRRTARLDPDHEWVIEFETPMTGIRYTRQSNGEWLATHRSMGFA